jgi:hypothetical protein
VVTLKFGDLVADINDLLMPNFDLDLDLETMIEGGPVVTFGKTKIAGF